MKENYGKEIIKHFNSIDWMHIVCIIAFTALKILNCGHIL